MPSWHGLLLNIKEHLGQFMTTDFSLGADKRYE
ncbi:hypothetical protein SNOG_12753 [Parastagonospora nodorum SN15]|uniref:Uncharacterized protein n=1 Tax=Phaeosphaeria nodorum (strain SN15 / ATCC MYA-4574 / FGSC 10173) TaxID=321614 RepID=Q0U661_PHANO|nr:hypothetical protein SNOG_12753 [Parastagonospora nodorum SN15]EAT80051.1 hypothetical protein SNOG_12753 [Parastagonospora nodorum SN15]